MAAERPFALIQGDEQWLMCSHGDTALLDGAVQLHWRRQAPIEATSAVEPTLNGMAFDCSGRLYRSLVDEGRLVFTSQPGAQARDLFEASPAIGYGDFAPYAAPSAGALDAPVAVALDSSGVLYIAEHGAKRILAYDTATGRLRRVRLPAAPLDLAARGSGVTVLLAAEPWFVDVSSRGAFRASRLVKPGAATNPARIVWSPGGRLYLLDQPTDAPAAIYAVGRERPFAEDLHNARDLVILDDVERLDSGAAPVSDGILVVARRAGEPFLRFRIGRDGAPSRLEPLSALTYRGDGIERSSANRAVYWTPEGVRESYRQRVRYERQGIVASFRLDSGEFHTQWGRLFLDACVPAECAVEAAFLTADDPPLEEKVPAALPANRSEGADVPAADWPLPPKRRVDEAEFRPLHQRSEGRELAFVRMAEGDPFETFEAPVAAPPGRYLWIVLRLTGSATATPRVRSLRAEHPGHSLLKRLPKTLSRDEAARGFLLSYLASLEGSLNHLDRIAEKRHVLLQPDGAPSEILPWLAGFVGMTLDERWSERARRTAIREAIALYRSRGTKQGLRRMIEIYTETPVILIEKFQLRGLGEGLLGGDGDPRSSAILGGGFRVGGKVGVEGSDVLDESQPDAFETHAHRFGVVIPAKLQPEQIDVVRHIVEWNKPAHTINEFDVCTVDAGIRIGRGAHVGLTTVVGPSERVQPAILGSTVLGRGQTVGGRGEPGSTVGGRLDRDTRVN